MTAKPKNPLLTPGEQFHFLESGFTFAADMDPTGASGQISKRGQTVTITEGLIEASKDRTGESWLDMLGDDDTQIDRYGRVMIRPGGWPDDEKVLRHGSPEWGEQREHARLQAWDIRDPRARQAALDDVEARFGKRLTTSRTLSKIKDQVSMSKNEVEKDRLNRRRSVIFRNATIVALAELGLPGLMPTPDGNLLSERVNPDRRRGSIQGLDGWTIGTFHQLRQDLSTATNTTSWNAQANHDPFAVAIVPRHTASASEAYAVMTLRNFADLVKELQRLQNSAERSLVSP